MKKTFILISVFIATLFIGCSSKQVTRSSSVVEYLYPNNQKHIEKPSIPHLNLPLRVGIAFVPESGYNSMTLTEVEKMDMMAKISQNFKKFAFVHSIEIIPSAYLNLNGSFKNLEQIRKMYNIDIIALVSFDQTQFTDPNFLSLTYWTIIGAYIIPAEKNDTHTMIDTVVYDIRSKKMLFRAPGIHKVNSHATYIGLSEQLRKDSRLSFQEARKALIINLENELTLFKNKVKNNPKAYKVTRSEHYTGGGSMDLVFLFLLLLIGVYSLYHRRKVST